MCASCRDEINVLTFFLLTVLLIRILTFFKIQINFRKKFNVLYYLMIYYLFSIYQHIFSKGHKNVQVGFVIYYPFRIRIRNSGLRFRRSGSERERFTDLQRCLLL